MQVTDQAPLLFDFQRVLAEPLRVRKIDAARVGRDRNAAMSPLRATVGEKRQAAVAHHLDVAHHVSVGDGHEALGVKEAPDFDLIGDRFTHGLALAPVEHRLFFRGQLHTLTSLSPRRVYWQLSRSTKNIPTNGYLHNKADYSL